MGKTSTTTAKEVLGESDLENKTIEELENEMELQKSSQSSLIKKINEQGYQEEGDREKIFNFDKNINLIYGKIKEMKKSL